MREALKKKKKKKAMLGPYPDQLAQNLRMGHRHHYSFVFCFFKASWVILICNKLEEKLGYRMFIMQEESSGSGCHIDLAGPTTVV